MTQRMKIIRTQYLKKNLISQPSWNLKWKMIPNVNDYQQLSPRTHVRVRPDMYVGSVAIQERDEYLAVTNPTTGATQITPCTIHVSDAIERTFLEILSNAADNVGRSRKVGLSEHEIRGIDVQVTHDTVTVVNYGLPISLDIHPEAQIRLPTMIFGRLLTGSNYGSNREFAGTNGLGAKAVSIFSTDFEVTVASVPQQAIFKQVWHNGMHIEEPEAITAYHGDSSYVSISYKLDFAAFQYYQNQYTEVDIALFKRHVMDASFTNKIITSFNGETFDLRNIKKYVKTCSFIPEGAAQLVHLEYPTGVTGGTESDYFNHPKALPSIELCVIETPDNAHNIAFANGLINRMGGVHLENAIEVVSTIMTSKVNALFEKNGHKNAITKADVRKHVSIIISCRVINPTFESQSKTMLKSPKIKIKLEEEETNRLNKFGLLYKRLLGDAEAKAFKKLAKGNGKKSRHVDVDASEDANFAGTKRSQECVLMLTEGKSAMGYTTQAVQHMPGGRDIWGVYPMKGKPLNTMNASIMKIIGNAVIMELKKMLGLREQVDYAEDAAFRTLRYGKILIMADSDEDGKHIVALVINMFHSMYPSLIRRGFIMLLRTPIVRASKGSHKLSFYSHRHYHAWAEATPGYQSWDHKYLKGLGCSNPKEVAEDFQTPKYVQVLYDDSSNDYLKLAFDDKLADERKRWIAAIQEPLGVEEWEMLPISHFINEELVTFARDNLARSIPRMMDGLKDSQRKIIWGAYCKWGGCGRYEDGTRKLTRSDIKTSPSAKSQKVDSFAGFVYENTAYKHGQPCLAKTITGMASDYPGSNNMAYFFQDGMFGTRNLNGQDAAQPRYAMLGPNWWMPYIYKIEDFPLMEFRRDEGHDQEPILFFPILPMVLINGADGIGSGHSTFVPKFNPLDIIEWYRKRLQGIVYQHELVPWYRGFTGTIELIDVKGDRIASAPYVNGTDPGLDVETVIEQDTDIDSGEEMPDEIGMVGTLNGRAARITGCLNYGNDGSLIVTDIPIGRSIHGYKNFLTSLIQQGLLADFSNHSTDHLVNFTLTSYTGPVTYKDLRLVATMGMSNMVLLDEQDIPLKYPTTASILEAFYNQRLSIYQRRKDYMTNEELRIIKELEDKLRLVIEIVTGTLIVFKRAKAEVIKEMLEKGYSKELYTKITLSSLTNDDIGELETKISNHKAIYQQLINTTLESMWSSDLDEFEKAYKKHYKC